MESPEVAVLREGFEANLEPEDIHLEELVVSGNEVDSGFDSVVGHIEDIIIEPEFCELQNNYLERFSDTFDNDEENKLEYTVMFQEYTEALEKHLQKKLKQRIPGFSMEDFLNQIKLRKDTLDGEVFEMLLSFTDFIMFKEMVLDYKAAKAGVVDMSFGLTITSMKQ